MVVRDSSANAYKSAIVNNSFITNAILTCVKAHGVPVTRRQIAEELNLETATVSGIVKPLVVCGLLVELEEKQRCPITDRHVYFVIHKDNVEKQFAIKFH